MISHRGEKYEIGRGKRFYGIWVDGAPYEAPIDRWPESRDGWEQAWTRFAAIETPGTIGAVSHGRMRPRFSLGRGGPTPGNPAVSGTGGAGAAAAGDTLVFRDTAATEDTVVVRDTAVSYTHLRAHETRHDLVCRLLLEKKKKKIRNNN